MLFNRENYRGLVGKHSIDTSNSNRVVLCLSLFFLLLYLGREETGHHFVIATAFPNRRPKGIGRCCCRDGMIAGGWKGGPQGFRGKIAGRRSRCQSLWLWRLQQFVLLWFLFFCFCLLLLFDGIQLLFGQSIGLIDIGIELGTQPEQESMRRGFH